MSEKAQSKFSEGFMRLVLKRAYIRGDRVEDMEKLWGNSFDAAIWNDIAKQVAYFEENNPLFRHETAKHFNVEKEDYDLER
jgi:hypothetical protein